VLVRQTLYHLSHAPIPNLFLFYFIFLAVLGFEPSCLLGRNSTWRPCLHPFFFSLSIKRHWFTSTNNQGLILYRP
jgi:hypothetical protein